MKAPHEIDRTPCAEFSVSDKGNLLVRGQVAARVTDGYLTRDDIARIVAAVNLMSEDDYAAWRCIQEPTEAQVTKWFQSQAAGLRAQLAAGYINIALNSRVGRSDHTYWCAQDDLGNCCMAVTLAEAVRDLADKRGTPGQQAAEKRAQAAKLLAEADAIAPEGRP